MSSRSPCIFKSILWDETNSPVDRSSVSYGSLGDTNGRFFRTSPLSKDPCELQDKTPTTTDFGPATPNVFQWSTASNNDRSAVGQLDSPELTLAQQLAFLQVQNECQNVADLKGSRLETVWTNNRPTADHSQNDWVNQRAQEISRMISTTLDNTDVKPNCNAPQPYNNRNFNTNSSPNGYHHTVRCDQQQKPVDFRPIQNHLNSTNNHEDKLRGVDTPNFYQRSAAPQWATSEHQKELRKPLGLPVAPDYITSTTQFKDVPKTKMDVDLRVSIPPSDLTDLMAAMMAQQNSFGPMANPMLYGPQPPFATPNQPLSPTTEDNLMELYNRTLKTGHPYKQSFMPIPMPRAPKTPQMIQAELIAAALMASGHPVPFGAWLPGLPQHLMGLRQR